jgi:hypothetical protein
MSLDLANAPDTANPLPLTITGVAGSITHSITLYVAVGTGQEEASASHRPDRLSDQSMPLSSIDN